MRLRFTFCVLAGLSPLAHAADLPLPSLQEIERAQAEAGLVDAEIARLTKRQQLETLRQQFAPRLPVLVGIVSDGDQYVAELLDSRGLREVRRGELIAPGWRVRAVHQDRLELVRASGGRYTLLLGSSEPTR